MKQGKRKKKENIGSTDLTDSEAADPEIGPMVKVMKSAVNK